MKFLLFSILLFSFCVAGAQDENEDYGWWNQLHNWKEGDPGWRNWMKITPGYFGPNALPVPDVKRGIIEGPAQIEATFSNHFHPGDPTQDISGKLFLPFAKNKIAIEMYGVMLERYAYSEKIRNERFSRDRDGKGFAFGDFYFSTLVQISKDRKFPNTLFRFAAKTASGNQLEAARYTDSPGYFFDLSFSKPLIKKSDRVFRPFTMLGFYSWQTNDELNLQNDAFLYAIGTDYLIQEWRFSTSLAGYSGYKNRRDRPVQINFDVRKKLRKNALRLQYLHGLRDWEYRTVRFSFIWNLNPKE